MSCEEVSARERERVSTHASQDIIFSAHYPPLYPIPITLITTIIIACYRLSPAQHRRIAHNRYNHKLTKEITNQSPRAKTLDKNLDPCWPYKDQGKTSVDKNPVG